MKQHLNVLTGMMVAAVSLPAITRAQPVSAAQAARIVVAAKDSAMHARLRTVDSLVRKLNNLPIASAEFLATDSTLQAVLREMRPQGVVGEFRFEIAAPSTLRSSPTDVVPRGTLGFTADGVNRVWYTPRGTYVQYFEYPTIIGIEANSPAWRAGVQFGDSVVAYNGLDVRKQAINLTSLLTPGREISVRVRRDGEARDVVVPVDKAPEKLIAERRAEAVREMTVVAFEERRAMENQIVASRAGSSPQGPARAPVAVGSVGPVTAGRFATGTFVARQSGVLGAAMVNVDKDLASSIRGMDGKRGVYVTFVPEGSLADRAVGLRGGDVILRVGASEVTSVGALGVLLMAAEQNAAEKIKLLIMRAGKTQDLTYTPPR